MHSVVDWLIGDKGNGVTVEKVLGGGVVQAGFSSVVDMMALSGRDTVASLDLTLGEAVALSRRERELVQHIEELQ